MTYPGFQAQQASQQAQQASQRASQQASQQANRQAQWGLDQSSRNFRHSQYWGSGAADAVARLARLTVTLIIMAVIAAIGLAIMNHMDPGWFAHLTG